MNITQFNVGFVFLRKWSKYILNNNHAKNDFDFELFYILFSVKYLKLVTKKQKNEICKRKMRWNICAFKPPIISLKYCSKFESFRAMTFCSILVFCKEDYLYFVWKNKIFVITFKVMPKFHRENSKLHFTLKLNYTHIFHSILKNTKYI